MTSVSNPPETRTRRRSVRLLVTVAVMALALAACGGKSEIQLAADALDAGIAAHSAGNAVEAERQYQECLKHEVTNKFCHYNLGLLAQTAGDNTTAENEYRLSLSTDPDYAPSIFNLAIIRTGADDMSEAISLYTKYTQLRPDELETPQSWTRDDPGGPNRGGAERDRDRGRSRSDHRCSPDIPDADAAPLPQPKALSPARAKIWPWSGAFPNHQVERRHELCLSLAEWAGNEATSVSRKSLASASTFDLKSMNA